MEDFPRIFLWGKRKKNSGENPTRDSGMNTRKPYGRNSVGFSGKIPEEIAITEFWKLLKEESGRISGRNSKMITKKTGAKKRKESCETSWNASQEVLLKKFQN